MNFTISQYFHSSLCLQGMFSLSLYHILYHQIDRVKEIQCFGSFFFFFFEGGCWVCVGFFFHLRDGEFSFCFCFTTSFLRRFWNLLPHEILNQEGENEAKSRYPFSMNLSTMCVNQQLQVVLVGRRIIERDRSHNSQSGLANPQAVSHQEHTVLFS